MPNNRVSQEMVFSEIESLLHQLDKLSPTSEQALQSLKAKLTSLGHSINDAVISNTDVRFFREHFAVIKQLRNNKEIVITKPDKGSGVVILDRTDYVNKMANILDDPSTFSSLGPCSTMDNTPKNETKLRNFLLGLSKSKNISWEIYKRIKPTGSQRPRLYGLPKIHKPGTPLRPILSMIGSAQHELAKWLSNVLTPVLEHYSTNTIKDSFTFVKLINDSNFSYIDTKNCFLTSFDISSLFTKVPLKETIDICADFLFSNPENSPSFTKSQFLELMNWATSSVEFSFNDIMYRQVNGVAMGSPLGPILANIFVGYQESRLFDGSSSVRSELSDCSEASDMSDVSGISNFSDVSEYHECYRPVLYKRYVDDTFVIFSSKDEFEAFYARLNSLHPALNFTFEIEKENKLPFLDVLVHKESAGFSTSLYRKPTFTGQYLRWDSFCPSSRKINLVKCLVQRATKICSNKHLNSEIRQIKAIFAQNGYPEHLVRSIISKQIASLSSDDFIGPSKCPVYVHIPWKGQLSLIHEKNLKSAVSKCFPAANLRVIHVTKSLLSHTNKDTLPSLQTNNVIYKFSCQCDAEYVGRTSQRLADRISQHVPVHLLKAIKTKRLDGIPSSSSRSSIAQHLINNPQCAESFSKSQFSIISKARSEFHLKVLEALFIHNMRPLLCKEKIFVIPLKLFKH